MSEITQLLEQAAAHSDGSLDDVFHKLHSELKALAHHQLHVGSKLTLSPTGLVSELYLKFVGSHQLTLESKRHFFACAATAMRQIIIDSARAANAGKRGGDYLFVTLTESGEINTDTEMLALNDAMDELKQVDSELCELVELKFFAGLSMDEIAGLKQRSTRSLQRDWTRARAFLHAQIGC